MKDQINENTARRIRFWCFLLVGCCLVILAISLFFVLRRPSLREFTVECNGKSFTFIREDTEKEDAADQAFSLQDQAFTSDQLNKIETILEPEKTSVSPNGELIYFNDRHFPTEATSALTWTESQAIKRAKQYLNDLGLLPQDEFLIKTSADVREEVDVSNETAGSPQTVSWTIWFYQTYNGVPVVSREDNGILMTISENGICSLQYNWKSILPQPSTMSDGRSNALSEDEAIDAYCRAVDLTQETTEHKIAYRQVYVYQDGEVVPAWAFGTEEAFLEPVYIHAFTGERIEAV